MMKRFFALVLSGAATLVMAAVALAGPQYVDKTGYAVSGFDVVAYHDLERVAVGQTPAKAVPGNRSITHRYNGALWAFSSAANRDKFIADPEKYVPQFDGHCAYGVSLGGKVPGNPHLWRIVDGKLYLNITKNVVGFWEQDIPGHIKTGTKNWSGLAPKPASTHKVPELDIANAPL